MNAEEFVYHECQGTIPILVPTYPGSEKLKEIMVCHDCESHWHSYRYSSAVAFFAPPRPEPKGESRDSTDTNITPTTRIQESK